MTCSTAWDTQATCFVQQHAHQRICMDMPLHDGIYASFSGEPRSGRCRLSVTICGCNAGSAWIPSVLFGKVGYFSSVTIRRGWTKPRDIACSKASSTRA
jgi:hypothetical protein